MYKAGSSSLAAREFPINSVEDKGGVFKLLKTESDGGKLKEG